MKGAKILTLLLAAGMVAGAFAQNYRNRGVWDPTEVYEGSYRLGTGDTVQYGTFPPDDPNGAPLYWWAKWWTQGETPGEFAARGGTSPWVMINSASMPGGQYNWVGWNGQLENTLSPGEAVVPTWKDGAEGAYTLIHDDIGALRWDLDIQPGLDVLADFPQVKTAWGVFVQPATQDEWDGMMQMTIDGHEMVNHSWNHTNAAEQWLWYNPGERIPPAEVVVPRTLTGLTVDPLWPPSSVDGNPTWPNPDQFTVENNVVEVTFGPTYWTGYDPSTSEPLTMTVTPKPGAEKVTLPTGMEVWVLYTKKDTLTGENEGYVAPTGANWMELDFLEEHFPERVNSVVRNDLGRPGWVCMLHLTDPWDEADIDSNVVLSKNIIDEQVYDRIRATGGFGPYFAPNKSTEYYVYPYDSYSEESHGWLEAAGYVGARGGAKSGEPMPGDFFHPYAIDYDAFYIYGGDTSNVINAGGNNPHQLLSLDGMVTAILETNGYMIRELHSVNIVEDWKNINDPLHDGWWGGIPNDLYRDHIEWIDGLITQNRLAVLTPSEAVKYRMVANAVTGVNMSQSGSEYRLTVNADNIADKYKDEISVIVRLNNGVEKLATEYVNGEQQLAGATWEKWPRMAPRKLDAAGTAWSVSINPYLGELKLLPNQDHEGGIRDDVSVARGTRNSAALSGAAFLGMQNNQISLRLPAGNYEAAIYNLNGQVVRNISLTSEGGIVRTSMDASISRGLYLLRVRNQAGDVALQSRIMLK
ncbi:hypothetical protein CHISP_1588 [Chitinispirillum alkaliphilum]|nr:hypothetical protein CHISP_1588 [Chitinispirillum alkaliphilum]